MINFYSIDETLDLLSKNQALVLSDCDSALIGTWICIVTGKQIGRAHV